MEGATIVNDYTRQPKTAVVEGLSSALASVASDREMKGVQDVDLSEAEIAIIEDEITSYILRRFSLYFKE